MKKTEESVILIPHENFWNEYFGWKMLKTVLRIRFGDLEKKARLGSRAPNVRLVSTDGAAACRLLDFIKGNRPLVVNFGSCS